MLDKINFGDGVARFDLRKEGAKHFHHHLVCMECGKVEEIEEDLLPEVENRVENEFNFKILDHRLTFHVYVLNAKPKISNNLSNRQVTASIGCQHEYYH